MKKRVKSEENLQLARDLPYLVCKRRPPSEVHHLKTRASNGGDEIENIIPVCRMDHVKIHQYGLSKMVGLSESLKKALVYIVCIGTVYAILKLAVGGHTYKE